MGTDLEKEALEYHSKGKPGKVEVTSSKACNTEYLLSLAYSPGVAAPCKEIAKNENKVYDFTTKGNLVAVVTNGTAVLGLGDIGPLAGKPVMEGKGVLFKQFANIDVFDIELNAKTADEVISAVKALEPTFGGVNLEDIAAPDCFIIEETLRREMQIPVFHDDQHGTAIISGAALINSCHITGRSLNQIKVVFNGAGAASIACARLFVELGVKLENILMCDSKGVIRKGRKDLNPYKEEFAVETDRKNLADALKGADVFVGLSVANVMTEEMLLSMNDKAIVFAMANPDPEINPDLAKKIRPDIIVATGRSDFPNQVNNVLGFPFIFRGALDVRATQINEAMKLAAVHALAKLAREDVPDSVSEAYGGKTFSYGPNYIIPKPFDPRVLLTVAPAVAKAAQESGVARQPIEDFVAYRDHLETYQGARRGFVRNAIHRVKNRAKATSSTLPRIIFPEGRSTKILKALQTVIEEQIVEPVLLGDPAVIRNKIKELDLDNFDNVEIINPYQHQRFSHYVETLYQMRHRKGVMKAEAERLMSDTYYFSAMAVHLGDADGLVSGATQNYADCVRPVLEIIGAGKRRVASGLNLLLLDNKILFFADTTVNIDPRAEDLATIAIHASRVAEYFKIEPRIAMLSFSNFSGKSESAKKMKMAAELVRKENPNLIVDGEMQADTAVNPAIVERIFPFCQIKNGANILIFPNLDAGNIAYKLLQQLGGGEVLGPFLMGVRKPANVLQRTCGVEDIVNTIVLTALECQAYKEQVLDK